MLQGGRAAHGDAVRHTLARQEGRHLQHGQVMDFLSIYLSIYLSICHSVYLSIYLSLSIYIHLSIFTYLYIYIFINIYIYISKGKYIYIYIYVRIEMPCATLSHVRNAFACGISHIMYQLNGFRKSTPPQKRQRTHNVSIQWFQDVNSPTKPSFFCLILLIKK